MWIEFRAKMEPFRIFSVRDVENHENIEWLAANLIYAPSYISLHTALSWYNLIPEMIVSTTSVTTQKTNKFSTPLGNLDYHRIKPELFGFGYSYEDMDAYGGKSGVSRKIMLATPQKAILDFFYINSFYDTEKDMKDLRLNETELGKIINAEFYQFLGSYGSRALEHRVHLMTKIYSI